MLIKLTVGAVVVAASILGAGAAVATPVPGPDASQTARGGIQFIARFEVHPEKWTVVTRPSRLRSVTSRSRWG
jgi:hypothetical protein